MLSKLWSALGRVIDAACAVADSLHGLAATVRQADAHARQQLGLDAAPPVEQLPQPAKNGRRLKPAA